MSKFFGDSCSPNAAIVTGGTIVCVAILSYLGIIITEICAKYVGGC